MSDEIALALERVFWPKGARRGIWMIADGARDRRVYSLLLDSHLDYSCLYSGYLAPEIKLAAPYLVALDCEDRDTRRLLNQCWGKSWGVFLRCDLGLEQVRRHLRTLLTVRDRRGNQMLFRFYDPRILRVFLPTCTPEELQTVFGPVERFWMEAENPVGLLEFGVDASRRLTTGEISVSSTGAALEPAGAERRI